MTDIALLDDLFFTRPGMDKARTRRLVEDALHGADDGEFLRSLAP